MDNVTILKYTLLLAAAPIWWPFMKTLYEDLKDALREEGGLFGAPPHPRKLEEIRREKARQESHLLHEPRVVPGQRRAFGNQRAGARARSNVGGAGGAGSSAPQRGFR